MQKQEQVKTFSDMRYKLILALFNANYTYILNNFMLLFFLAKYGLNKLNWNTFK